MVTEFIIVMGHEVDWLPFWTLMTRCSGFRPSAISVSDDCTACTVASTTAPVLNTSRLRVRGL
jgi:hypothetical protein